MDYIGTRYTPKSD